MAAPGPLADLAAGFRAAEGRQLHEAAFSGGPAPSLPCWGPEVTGPAPSLALNRSVPQRSSPESNFLLGKNVGVWGEGKEVTPVGFVFFTSCYKCKLVTAPQNATLAPSHRPCKKTWMNLALRDTDQPHSWRGRVNTEGRPGQDSPRGGRGGSRTRFPDAASRARRLRPCV